MNKEYKNVLALAPHTDDVEVGCGGTLARLKREGADIHVITFSYPHNKPEIKKEFKNSMNILGATYQLEDFPLRRFDTKRQDILELLYIESKKDYDLILTPSSFDTHQDHEVIRNESYRVFKYRTILGYIHLFNCKEHSNNCFITLSDEDMCTKRDMLNCYQSQQFRSFSGIEYADQLALTIGRLGGVKYAELFEVIKFII